MALQQAVRTSVAEEAVFDLERRLEKAALDGEAAEVLLEILLELLEELKVENVGELKRALKGELKGEFKALNWLLRQQFGVLPADVTARIDAASREDRNAMTIRVLTATTLDEVLGTPTQKPS